MLSERTLRNDYEIGFSNDFPTFLSQNNHLGHNAYVSPNGINSLMLAQQSDLLCLITAKVHQNTFYIQELSEVSFNEI